MGPKTRLEKEVCSCSSQTFLQPALLDQALACPACTVYGDILSNKDLLKNSAECRWQDMPVRCLSLKTYLQARSSRIELPAVQYGRQGPWAINLWFKPSNESGSQFQYLFSHNSTEFSDYAGHQYSRNQVCTYSRSLQFDASPRPCGEPGDILCCCILLVKTPFWVWLIHIVPVVWCVFLTRTTASVKCLWGYPRRRSTNTLCWAMQIRLYFPEIFHPAYGVLRALVKDSTDIASIASHVDSDGQVGHTSATADSQPYDRHFLADGLWHMVTLTTLPTNTSTGLRGYAMLLDGYLVGLQAANQLYLSEHCCPAAA